MQYTISMTSRMLAISALCIFLLCVLLFLLGIELGKRYAESQPAGAAASVSLPAVPPVPAPPAAAPLPGAAPAPAKP